MGAHRVPQVLHRPDERKAVSDNFEFVCGTLTYAEVVRGHAGEDQVSVDDGVGNRPS